MMDIQYSTSLSLWDVSESDPLRCEVVVVVVVSFGESVSDFFLFASDSNS